MLRGRALSKLEDAGVEVYISGECPVCGMWLSFNRIYGAWEGELSLPIALLDIYFDRDCVVRPD
jgi:hypothetical protein